MNIDKNQKYKKDRRRILEYRPLVFVVVLYLLAFVYIPIGFWSLDNERDVFTRFLYQEIGSCFIPVFFLSYIWIKKYKEQVFEKWVLFTGYGLLFALEFYYPRIHGHNELVFAFANVFYVFLISILAYVVYLAYDRGVVVREKYKVEQQSLKSEMALLKNQINPHFLFNTLNNIDSLIKKNPDKASASLIDLSDMMRYMLYETNSNRVALTKELAYIENFMELQAMHHANPNLVACSINGEVGEKRVAPMLFIPFIENAFKHCTNKDEQHAIRFSFDIDNQRIIFKASNLFDRTKKISKDQSSGVGLDIVHRRLDYLYYKRYQLDIKEENGLYIVNLTIDECN